MKILIIAKYFPPQNGIASLRPHSWAKWWSNLGHEVTVVSTKKIPRENDLKLDCSGFDLIEIPVPVESFLDRINPIAVSPAIGRDVSKNNKRSMSKFASTSFTGIIIDESWIIPVLLLLGFRKVRSSFNYLKYRRGA